MYLNPSNLSVLEEVSNRGLQSYLRKELQLSGWDFYPQPPVSSQFPVPDSKRRAATST